VHNVLFMKIGHSQRYIFAKTDQQLLVELLLLFVKVVEEAASRKELSYHGILVIIDAHSHVKHYTRMVKAINYLNFLNKMANMPIPKALLL
jgi:hypothetical protein